MRSTINLSPKKILFQPLKYNHYFNDGSGRDNYIKY